MKAIVFKAPEVEPAKRRCANCRRTLGSHTYHDIELCQRELLLRTLDDDTETIDYPVR